MDFNSDFNRSLKKFLSKAFSMADNEKPGTALIAGFGEKAAYYMKVQGGTAQVLNAVKNVLAKYLRLLKPDEICTFCQRCLPVVESMMNQLEEFFDDEEYLDYAAGNNGDSGEYFVFFDDTEDVSDNQEVDITLLQKLLEEYGYNSD